MTPEQLAPILYTARRQASERHATLNPTWEQLAEGTRREWLAVAEVALAALRGPRTGEELHNAFQTALAANGVPGTPYSWDLVKPDVRRALIAVAATFAAPKPPEGWPEGCRHGAALACHGERWSVDLWAPDARGCACVVYAASAEQATERARLIAHTLANGAPVQPTSTVDHGAEIERLKTALRIAEAGNRGREDTIKGLERERDEARAAEADAQQRRQRVKAIAMDLAGELADVRLAELTGRIEGADE